MVGIVLVSHSHEVAEGVAALARQMGGADVAIATAGGLEGADHPVGTDAARIVEAVELVWSRDGVLVLMDLGSAVLSAEMALDFLDPDHRRHVMLSPAPFVEGAVSAAVAAKLGRPLATVAEEALGGLAGKTAHLDAGSGESNAAASAGLAPEPEARITFVVDLPHGLHARPAARLVQTAGAFDADVSVTNVTAGRGPVSARSLNAVATLGVTVGQRIEVAARGPQSGPAIEAIRTLADRRFDEAADDLPAPDPTAPTSSAAADGALLGIPASPGVAVGPARRLHLPDLPLPNAPAGTLEEERARLDAALAAVREDITRQRDGAVDRVGRAEAAIFDAHLLFLGDDALLGPVKNELPNLGAARAWNEAVETLAEAWQQLDDPYLRERAGDLRSVGRQVLARLLGVDAPRGTLLAPGVLVAGDLEPADTIALDPETCRGIATAHGGPTSHAAVLARAVGIPAVVGLGEQVLGITEGTIVGLDGASGAVYVDPSTSTIAGLEADRSEGLERQRAARSRAHEPAHTKDGQPIEVLANVGGPSDVETAVAAGCDGVGLFRTEFLFIGRDRLPTEDEQERVYRAAASALGGRPMTVRTLDAGADKPIAYLRQPPEANPFLGVRGLRLMLAHPEILTTQLRALTRVAADHPVKIMFPMVTTLEELQAGLEAVDEVLGTTSGPRPSVGVMIEVPSAALEATHLARIARFFSVGTNDLTQYTLAADRGNERVGALADPLHPSVLRLIAMTAEAGIARAVPTAVCGELAADPTATPLLLGLGVRELSMNPLAIPQIKDAVRAVDLGEAAALGAAALACATATEVRKLLSD
jgi:phosphoenolpyruvate-protein phosphotransferase/dihydroxyacetone kinase phosphotransfer subunit